MPRVKLNSGLFVFVRPSPVGYESSSNFTIQVNLPEYPPEKAALNCGQEHTMVPGRRSDVPGPRPEFPTMVRFSPRATGPQDTGPPDHRTTGHRTTGHRTTGPPDTGPSDTGPPDTDHRISGTRHRTTGHWATGPQLLVSPFSVLEAWFWQIYGCSARFKSDGSEVSVDDFHLASSARHLSPPMGNL